MSANMQLPQLVKSRITSLDNQAQVILFGSHARGDANADSDWDFLILFDNSIDYQLEDTVRDLLYEIELDTGEIISSVIDDKNHWQQLEVTPLFRNIQREGIEIKLEQQQ